MVSMSAVHEEMNGNAQKREDIWQRPHYVGLVLGP